MADKKDEYAVPPSQITDLDAIQRVDESRFTATMDEVVKESEDMRLRYMQRHGRRAFLTMSFGMALALGGAAAFGWFFFVEFNLARAALCMIPALLVPIFMHSWSEAPIKHYVRDYKKIFMPKMAAALGGFKFYPARGIPREIIGKTGVVPAHNRYDAEDCFMGTYKGAKVIFSEARLHKGRDVTFEGLFVLLETAHKVFEGHTIITADRAMAKRSASTRWAKLPQVNVKAENPEADRFVVFSDKPDDAALLAGEKLLKELADAADIFGKAELTAAFFRGKYIFMMIPHKGNMFEPSGMFVPVSTKQHALHCKREIERIMEIVDIFDLYKASPSAL
ncbi:MAG: DUF3137 domain-containing protein [Alphaproteobacteria bacterium]